MYSVDDRDQVVRLSHEQFPYPDTGAPVPLLLASEHCVTLAYFGGHTSFSDLHNVVIVSFRQPISHMWGMPNEEAFEGHPLAWRGLESFTVYIVENSSWLRHLEQMNRVHENHDPASYFNRSHYIISFHDSTFECIARSFDWKSWRGDINTYNEMPELLESMRIELSKH